MSSLEATRAKLLALHTKAFAHRQVDPSRDGGEDRRGRNRRVTQDAFGHLRRRVDQLGVWNDFVHQAKLKRPLRGK